MRHIDIHSHFFNIQFAFREALAIARDVVWGTYPFGHSGVISEDVNWQGFTSNLRELVYTAIRSCENQMRYHQRSYANSDIPDREVSLITTPLTMDIYYVAASDVVDQVAVDGGIFSDLPNMSDLQERLSKIVDELYRGVVGYVSSIGFDQIARIYDEFSAAELEEGFIGDLEDILSELWRLLLKGTDDLSWGFERQLWDIIKLKEENPELIYPFFAVDPRRPNVMKYVEKYVGVGPARRFSGIKLYPALGYLPSHPNLLPVWEYCLRHDLPICVHASDGGFPSLATNIHARSFVTQNKWVSRAPGEDIYWASREFGDPDHWKEVLNYQDPENPDLDFSKLRVNFAHFGAKRGTSRFESDWTVKIIDLMDNFENIYADLSYREDVSVRDIDDLVNMAGNEIVSERLMFGTDYPVVMLEDEVRTLSDYFTLYRDLPGSMFCRNAHNYLAGILDHEVCTE